MRNTLKEYIDQHRSELDVAVPSDKLWTNIENAMIVAIPATTITSGIPWLKYFAFGLSTVAATAVVYTALNTSTPQPAVFTSHPEPGVVTDNKEVAFIPAVSAPGTDFILLNTATELPVPQMPEIFEEELFLASSPADTSEVVPEQIVAKTTLVLHDSMFTGIRRVELISTSAMVTVKGTDENTLSVIRGGTNDSVMKLEYTRTDTLLRINARIECGKPKITRSRKGFAFNSCTTANPEITLLVPAGTSVVVQNTYGDTKVSAVSGAVCEVRSTSGNVVLASVKANTNVIASYGDLDARDITGNLTARLSSGSAVVNNVTGNLDVRSTYGDQSLTAITGNIKALGSSGNINVSRLRGNLTANTTYGSIHISDFTGSANLISSSGSIVGEAVELTANSTFVSTYGDVNMTLVNPLQALSFDLTTTYGDILIDKNGEQFRDEHKLSLTRGGILIKATSSSGNQVFK